MASHMKTTVQIPDALLAEIQKIAAKNKTTLRALMQEGLQHVVDRERMTKKPFKLKDGSVSGNGLTKEFEKADWEQIRDLLYEGRGS
jgi:hypothetical protein